MRWIDEAACRSVDPELFFPVAVEGTQLFELLAGPALAVCARCPVRPECLDAALKVGAAGIWGGVTEGGRRQLRVDVAV